MKNGQSVGIKIRFIEGKEFLSFFRKNRDEIFQSDFDFNIDEILSDEEKNKRRVNAKALREVEKYYLVAEIEDRIVGWSCGIQKSHEDFYMINSAVFPEFRRSGIYMQMLKKQLIEYLSLDTKEYIVNTKCQIMIF